MCHSNSRFRASFTNVLEDIPMTSLYHSECKWSISSFHWWHIRFHEILHYLQSTFSWQIHVSTQLIDIILSFISINSITFKSFLFNNILSSLFSSNSLNSLLHIFTCLCNDHGSLKLFPHRHLNPPFASFLTSIILSFWNLILITDWWSCLMWLFKSLRFPKMSLHIEQVNNIFLIIY
jgi:hypothetical protein